MISYHTGDLLESGCDIICHQVNLQGIMGGGLAYQIAQKYPECEKAYKNAVRTRNMRGGVTLFKLGNAPWIGNCFSQNYDFSTNYEWLKKCFLAIKQFSEDNKLKTVGVPYCYGCGIAYGVWDKVKAIFEEIFKDCNNIDFQIWRL